MTMALAAMVLSGPSLFCGRAGDTTHCADVQRATPLNPEPPAQGMKGIDNMPTTIINTATSIHNATVIIPDLTDVLDTDDDIWEADEVALMTVSGDDLDDLATRMALAGVAA